MSLIPPEWFSGTYRLSEAKSFLAHHRETVESVRERLRALGRQLVGRNVYISFSFEVLAEEMPVGALVGAILDVELRRAIGESWQGPGAAILLSSQWFASGFTWIGRSDPVDKLFELYTPVLVHECAHLVGWDEPKRVLVSQRAYDLAASELATSRPGTGYGAHGDIVNHDLTFIRTALALKDRAEAITGARIRAAEVVDCLAYGLSPTCAYVALMHDDDAIRRLWINDLEQLSAASVAPKHSRVGEAPAERKSTMLSLVERLRKRQDVQKRTASEEYSRMVRELAEGKDLAIDRVEATMDAAGKNSDDLERDVARVKARRETRARIAEIEKAQLEVPELEKAIEKAQADYAEATNRFSDTIRPRAARIELIQQGAMQLDGLRESLIATADADLKAELAAIEEEARECSVGGLITIPGSPYGERQLPYHDIVEIAKPTTIARLRSEAAKPLDGDTYHLNGSHVSGEAQKREAVNRLREAEAAAAWLTQHQAKTSEIASRMAAVRRRMMREA